jgi:DNA-binding NarL/FixJ family response regulator
MRASTKLALVDDHILFRKTLFLYLSQQESIDIILEASDTGDLIANLKKKPVDILVTDIFMPQSDILQTLKEIKNVYPELKVIALSMCTDIIVINKLLDAGIYGYISKSDEPEELIKAVKSAQANRIYRNKFFTDALYWDSQKNRNSHMQEITFDEREKKIIQLLWEEKNNKEIAEYFFLSIRSIEKIRQDIKAKLGLKTTIGVLKYALNKKIITLPLVAEPLYELNVNYMQNS